MPVPRIDFYIIENPQHQRERLLCQIAEKAYKKKCRFYIQVDSEPQARALDDLLWTFRDGSFLPHAVLNRGDVPEVPALIGTVVGPASHRDVLFNLCDKVPENYASYQRVIEVIDESHKQLGRQHYQVYRQNDCPIETHKIQ